MGSLYLNTKMILKTLLFFHGIFGIFALPPVEVKSPSDVEIVPSIEASISTEEAKPEARFFFTQAFTTIYQTIGTSTLSTYPSCYSTQADIATCSSTVLTGRKKRESALEETRPMVEINGEIVDFREHIQASRVSREADLTPNPEHKKNIPGLFEASIEDVPQCLKGAIEARQRNQRQMITVTSTVTSFTYATTTVVVADTQSLVFSSAAAFCFPSQLVSSLSIRAC